MSTFFLLFLPVIIPILGGFGVLLLRFQSRTARQIYVGIIVVVTMLLSLTAIFAAPKGQMITLIPFTEQYGIALKIDGMAVLFGLILCTLWVVATFYAFEYMKHEGKENKFFAFYTMSFGVAMGLAFSANMLTFYLFYELLTLGTLPLVMHAMNPQALYAGKKYIIYSIGGASFAFIAMVFMMYYGTTLNFTFGGVFDAAAIAGQEQWLLVVFVLAFFGFGIKAAVFPLSGWLPSAGVAPTPVTALLHAVAVVNAGVYALVRLIYYTFGTEMLLNTWAQYTVMAASLVTIVYGSSMALRTQHLKRRLAYSTVSNLSYMIFGLTMMTPAGMVGGLTHMVVHSILKILAFFCVGAILYKTHKEYVYEINGFGRKMPITMATFTIAGIGLMGIPPLPGFLSKWNLGTAAVESGNPLAYAGIGVLILSTLLTALYIMQIVFKAYFPNKDINTVPLTNDVKDPNLFMTIPFILLAVAAVVLGIYHVPLMQLLQTVANGLF